jgi:hypothetical protein
MGEGQPAGTRGRRDSNPTFLRRRPRSCKDALEGYWPWYKEGWRRGEAGKPGAHQEGVMNNVMEPERAARYSDHHLTYLSAVTIGVILLLWILSVL